MMMYVHNVTCVHMCLLVCNNNTIFHDCFAESAVEEAEQLIRRVLVELDSPSIAGSTCTAELLLERTKACLDTIDTSTANFSLYNNDPACT